jgi:hypothetical protein
MSDDDRCSIIRNDDRCSIMRGDDRCGIMSDEDRCSIMRDDDSMMDDRYDLTHAEAYLLADNARVQRWEVQLSAR